MKKLFFLLICLYAINVDAQNLTSATDGKFFVTGISVMDTITLKDPDPECTKVDFKVLDASDNAVEGFSYTDSEANDGFTWGVDRSTLPINSKIVAYQYNSNEEQIGDSILLEEYTIIPKPEWLVKGSVSNIQLNDAVLSFEGKYPIYEYNHIFDKKVKLLGEKTLGLAGNFIFNASLNLKDGISQVADNKTVIDVNVLDYSNIKENINYETELSMDKDLNISIFASKEFRSKSVKWDSPEAKFPVCPPFGVFVSTSIEFYATLKGQIVIGQKEGKFGFIEDDQSRKTKIIGVVTGIGIVHGGLSVFGGTAKATASLIAKANLGVGFDYVTIPQEKSNLLFGGDFDLSGRVDINLFDYRWLKKLGAKPKNIYSDSTQLYYTYFGDTTALRGKDSFDNMFNSDAVTVKDSGSLVIPEFKPQPTFATRNDNLYAVWIENSDNEYQVLLSRYDYVSNQFIDRKIIVSDEYSKANPKIGILSDGSALITWTQLGYNGSDVNSETTINDLISSQDIWFAFYDVSKDSIIQTKQFNDANSSITDGRAEGQASISVGANNEAMVTWVSLNENQNSSDIWFSSFSKENNEWVITDPAKLIDVEGTNANVNVLYGDNSVALAVWINDPDGDDLTKDKQIVSAGWNGDNWDQNISVIASNNGTINYNNLSIASNKSKIALAYTSEEDDSVDVSKLNLEVYDLTNNQWDSNASFKDSSLELAFQNLQTSISNDGFASVAYQVVDKYNTGDNIDNGELYLYVKDLNASDPWKEITANSDLCDTNAFIWDMTAGFGPDNQYYVMTQEYNDNGVVTQPHKGILFGDPELSMVLRGLKINNDLTLTDIPEPETKTTRIKNLEAPAFRYNNNYPNPFERFTTIEFSLYKPAYVTLEIFNFSGTKVSTLIDTQLSQGIYKTNFDAGDLPGGIYYSKLSVDGNSTTGKMVLIK